MSTRMRRVSYRALTSGLAGVLVSTLALSAPVSVALAAGSLIRVSTAADGGEPNGNSFGGELVSSSGRYTSFYSEASNLVDGDVNGIVDVFRWDRQTGQTKLVSLTADGAQVANVPGYSTNSILAGMSSDGRQILFSTLSNVIDGVGQSITPGAFGGSPSRRLYVRDMDLNTSELVDQSSAGEPGNNGGVGLAAVSGDGRYVAFVSTQDNLVAGDTNTYQVCDTSGENLFDCFSLNHGDIFLRDLQSGTTERISLANDGGQLTGGGSGGVSMSADGNRIAYWTCATNSAGDGDNAPDLIVYDRLTATNHWIFEGNQFSCGPQREPFLASVAMSPDGSQVAFSTQAPLAPGDSGSSADVYILNWDQPTPTFEWLTANMNGQPATNTSFMPHFAGGTRYVSFVSFASDLVPGDTNGAPDAFVRDRATGVTKRVSVAANGVEANGSTQDVAMSADGAVVVYATDASNLITEDAAFERDIVLVDGWASLPNEPPAPNPDHVVATAPPGGTVATGGGAATPSDTTTTSLMTRAGGNVEISEAASDTPLGGYAFLGQAVSITAPVGTVTEPLRITFRLESTVVPAGQNYTTVKLFRNRELVPDCATPGNGTATPDPCIDLRTVLGDGDIALTALTTHASVWELAVVDDRTAPIVTLTTTPPAASGAGGLWFNVADLTRGASLSVVASATDNSGGSGVSSVTCSVDGGAPQTTSNASLNISPIGQGTHVVLCSALDRANNTSPSVSATYGVDSISPIVQFAAHPAEFTVDQTVVIACSASDSGSGIGTGCVAINAPAYSFPSGIVTRTTNAADIAGNVGYASTTFTITTTAGSLSRLTGAFVRTSSKYLALHPTQRAAVDALIVAASKILDAISPKLTQKQRTALILTYKNAVQSLVQAGWLTTSQGATLRDLADRL